MSLLKYSAIVLKITAPLIFTGMDIGTKSMDLCSEEICESKIITNDSFVDGRLESLLQAYKSTPLNVSQMHSSSETITPLIMAQSPTQEHLMTQLQCHEPVTTKPVISIVSFMRSLFPITAVDMSSERFLPITAIIINILKNLNELEVEELKRWLTGHVGLHEDGHPWLDLEGAYFLKLSNELWRSDILRPTPSSLLMCPRMIANLQDGLYVPMEHILHCLCIFQFHPQIEKYPYKFTEPVPYEFLLKIKRTDVIRGVNIHSLLLGLKFPLIAARFPSLIEELWDFMFIKKFSATAGMELYNEFFFEYNRKLGQGIVLPLEYFPPEIVDKVCQKFKS